MSIRSVLFGIFGSAILIFSSFSFAQSPLTTLFGLLDTMIEKQPASAQILLDKLEEYEDRVSPSKLQLVYQIRDRVILTYKRVTEVQQQPVAKIPDGYKSVTLDYVSSIMRHLHIQGPEDAPILLIEFLDFQCPYCQAQHNNEILDILRETEYPGKLRTAAAMFPLTGKRHELAQQAAESAECAYIQGGTQNYYDHKAGLYANGLVPTMNIIRQVGTVNGLDADSLEACISEGLATAGVAAQKNIGRNFGVRGTPGSVILDTRTGAYKTISGARSVDGFMGIVEELWNAGS